MNHTRFELTAEDGTSFHCYQWGSPNPRALVQIVHGVAEHAERYAPFAEKLVAHGFEVFADDHRGHGRTAGSNPGNMGAANALERVCQDVVQLSRHARAEFPGLPLVLFGHSMGSLISQLILPAHGELYDAVVLSGSPDFDDLVQARPMIDMAVAQAGRDAPATELQAGMFGAFLEGIDEPRTPFDWLSRDAKEVDKYVADPLCGFEMTLGSFQDIAAAAERGLATPVAARVPTRLPMLIFSGARDPANKMGAVTGRLYDRYTGAGLTRVRKHVYAGGRHEMLNETNREEVMNDIVTWIDDALTGTA